MQTSETINELATALAKAQGQLEGAKKDSTNPHFRSKYADLASVWDACRSALSQNGLGVIQSPRGIQIESGGWAVELETRLVHTSGQWVTDTITVPVGKADAQGIGSAVTYARRYALAAFVGVAPEDDDGNAASVGVGTTGPEHLDTRTHETVSGKPNGTGLLTVLRVEQVNTKKPGTVRYTVHFSNGTKASTINDRLGDIAKQLAEAGTEILPPVTRQSQYGTDLVGLHRKSEATVTSTDEPEITDADIPF